MEIGTGNGLGSRIMFLSNMLFCWRKHSKFYALYNIKSTFDEIFGISFDGISSFLFKLKNLKYLYVRLRTVIG